VGETVAVTPNLDAILAAADPRAYIAGLGEVIDVFDDQGSGCVSYGVAIGGRRWFVKTALTDETVAMLRRAWAFHQDVRHPAIVAPVTYAERGRCAAVCYPWHAGDVLNHGTASRHVRRDDPASPMFRFRAQPVATVERAIDAILDAHIAVAAAGYVAVDFYDGTMLYDPDTATMRLVDLDDYRRAPFTVGADGLSGSPRFFSPEETRPRATITEQTTVFTMGRTGRLLLDAGDREQAFRGTPAQLAVIARATRPDPTDRHPTVAAMVEAWRLADCGA
jgi:hypothetical protein